MSIRLKVGQVWSFNGKSKIKITGKEKCIDYTSNYEDCWVWLFGTWPMSQEWSGSKEGEGTRCWRLVSKPLKTYKRLCQS